MLPASRKAKFGLLALGLSCLVAPALAQGPLDGLTDEGWKNLRAKAKSSGYSSCIASASKQTTNQALVTSYCGCIAESIAAMPADTMKQYYAASLTNAPPTGTLKDMLDQQAAECIKGAMKALPTTQ
ncbi:hypothetical protein [Enterovirga sp. CN4-39]|uniref:hypothetical protein n=1 Tax=Enterovirga sp. CN4-39 TaxID=3400910 RepID=UPI003C120CB1